MCSGFTIRIQSPKNKNAKPDPYLSSAILYRTDLQGVVRNSFYHPSKFPIFGTFECGN
jgi:hypothetical protein